MEFRKITNDTFKVGDIIKLKDNFDYTYHTTPVMCNAVNRYVKITSIREPDCWTCTGYLRCEGCFVDEYYIRDYVWYPCHIDHIATQEEIEQATALFEETLMINDTQYYKCDICGEYTSEPTTHEDKTYCPYCKTEHLTECAYCHQIHPKNNTPLHRLNYREYICDDCLEEHREDIFWCDYHETYENGNPQHAPNGDIMCEEGFWEIYTICDDCGAYVLNDNAIWDDYAIHCCCKDCYDR